MLANSMFDWIYFVVIVPSIHPNCLNAHWTCLYSHLQGGIIAPNLEEMTHFVYMCVHYEKLLFTYSRIPLKYFPNYFPMAKFLYFIFYLFGYIQMYIK